MKQSFLFFIFFYFLTGCINGKKQDIPGKDSLKTNTNIPSRVLSEVEQSYNEMLIEYISKYSEKYVIDTVIDNIIEFKLTHYCLYDNGLVIPSRYNWGKSEKVFTTHNFASKLLIIKNKKDTIVNESILKKIFNSIIFEELNNYGVLLYPEFRGYDTEKKTFQVHYSISIPITDVGQSVIYEIGIDGKYRICKE